MDLGITQSMIKPIQGYNTNPNYGSDKKSFKKKTNSVNSMNKTGHQDLDTDIEERNKQSSDLLSLIKIANAKLNFFVNSNENVKKSEPVVVQIYLIFLRIGEIDNVKERFQCDAYFEASWEDDAVDIKTGFNPAVNWDPELFIENSVGNLKQDIKYRVENRNNRTKIVEMRTIKGIFWERLELGDFPLDVQNLSVSITSSRDKSEIIFEASSENESAINTKDFQQQQEWNLYTHIEIFHRDKYDAWNNHTRPCFTVSSTISRRPGYFIYNAYMLIFLINVLGFVPFCFSCTSPHFRIQTTCLLILSSLNFRYILSSKLPVISYLTTLDKYSIFAQIFLVLLCAWHAIIGCNYFRKQDKAHTQHIDNFGLITIAIFYVLYHLGYLVYFLIKFVRNSKIDQQKIEEVKKKEEIVLEEPIASKAVVNVESIEKPKEIKEKPKAKSKPQNSPFYSTITDINSDSFFNQKLKDIEIDPNRPVSFGYQINNSTMRSDITKKPNEQSNRSPYLNSGATTSAESGRNIQFQDNNNNNNNNNAKIVINPFVQGSSPSYRRTIAN